MKKVWVLEKFHTIEDANKTLQQHREIVEYAKQQGAPENIIKDFEEVAQKQLKKMEENPEGYWVGTEGKSVYREFCMVAKDAIRRHPAGTKFRVVEGEIKDDAKYWLGYKFVKENEGILKYLMATK